MVLTSGGFYAIMVGMKKFESYTNAIALNTIKLERGEMTVKDFVRAMEVILGTEVFERAIKILDRN